MDTNAKFFVRVKDVAPASRFQGFNVELEKVTPGVPFYRESIIANTFFVPPGVEDMLDKKRNDANNYARGLAQLLGAVVETSEG